MSKGTNDGSRWCAWKWAPTPEAPATRATARRTATRARAKLLLAVALAISCSRSPQAQYDLAWKSYQRGELAEVFAITEEHASRHAGKNPQWHWRFRLLQAETLTALGRNADAEALLGVDPLAGAGLDQLEARRLIDLASLRPARTQQANELLSKARTLVR